ncbi:MAG: YndJ-like protein [Ilumatobacteraceae bacterium]|nr:YndJ-like protein [Ilumatobacteraceae bacterium]
MLHQFGMVCVAMGLSFDDRFEVLGAGLLVGALALYSVAALQQRAGLNDSVRRTLLLISSVAWIAPMALATTWAFAPFGVTPIADRYESMLRYHGAVNAIGLVLVGLIAVVPRRRGARLPHTVTHTQKGPRHADALISHQ